MDSTILSRRSPTSNHTRTTLSLPTYYNRDLFKNLKQHKQGPKIIEEYYKEMDIAMIRANVTEDDEQTMARFLNGLNHPIKKIADFQPYSNHIELVHQATEAERQVQDDFRYAKFSSKSYGFSNNLEIAMIRANVMEDDEQIMARFLNGLNHPINKIAYFQPHSNLIELVHQATKAERQVQDDFKYGKFSSKNYSFSNTQASTTPTPSTSTKPSTRQIMARFLNGLNHPINKIAYFQPHSNLIELVHQATKAERQVQDDFKYGKFSSKNYSFSNTQASTTPTPSTSTKPSTSKGDKSSYNKTSTTSIRPPTTSNFKPRASSSSTPTDETIKKSSFKCFTCGARGHKSAQTSAP